MKVLLKIAVFTAFAFTGSQQQEPRHPRIVTRPSDPVFGIFNRSVTLNWRFVLLPSETWNKSVLEVSFGRWKYHLTMKLLVIDRQGQVLIQPSYENKISWRYNMSDFQVAVTLHNLQKQDETKYGIHVELGSARIPLNDAVKVYLQDPAKITTNLKQRIKLRMGDKLQLKCRAKGVPEPNVTWIRHGRELFNDTLFVKSAENGDGGIYTCKAQNSLGEERKQVHVTIDSDQKLQGNDDKASNKNSSNVLVMSVSILGAIALLTTIFIVILIYRRHRRKVPYMPQEDSITNGFRSQDNVYKPAAI